MNRFKINDLSFCETQFSDMSQVIGGDYRAYFFDLGLTSTDSDDYYQQDFDYSIADTMGYREVLIAPGVYALGENGRYEDGTIYSRSKSKAAISV